MKKASNSSASPPPSPMGRGLAILRETLDLLSPSRKPAHHPSKLPECSQLQDVCQEEEEEEEEDDGNLSDSSYGFCSSLDEGFEEVDEEEDNGEDIREDGFHPCLSSFPGRDGNPENGSYSFVTPLPKDATTHDRNLGLIRRYGFRQSNGGGRFPRRKPPPQRSFSSEIYRHGSIDGEDIDGNSIDGNSADGKAIDGEEDSSGIRVPKTLPVRRRRTRSLTDKDLQELRGCIDLGFGFSHDQSCDLTSTLPALELYYAINRNFHDMKLRSSPISTLDGNAMLERSSSGSSCCSDSWKISSPGDNPNQVKTRLRHWAQAVACSLKETL